MATAERRPDGASQSEPPMTMGAWCETHDLIGALLPFDCRATDTFAEFEALAAALNELRETQATFRLGDLETPDGHRSVKYRPTGRGIVSTQLHLLGAWEYRETSTGQRWLNPSYIHGHPWQTSQCSAEEREQILRHAARLGLLTREDVAPRLGMTKKGVMKVISRNDIPWQELRGEGVRRLARTVLTVRAWSDRSLPQVAEPLPAPVGSIKSYVQRYARDDGWTPPEDPSQYRKFRHGQGKEATADAE